jgi:heterodisulfide reductase subunit A
MAQGQAAAGAIQRLLVPGERIPLEPIVARVEEALCSGCRTCLALCPFQAIVVAATDRAVAIEEPFCRGCGICAAACPSGAITLCHFSPDAVSAELEGLLKADDRQCP